jgi:hypothetical protein
MRPEKVCHLYPVLNLVGVLPRESRVSRAEVMVAPGMPHRDAAVDKGRPSAAGTDQQPAIAAG